MSKKLRMFFSARSYLPELHHTHFMSIPPCLNFSTQNNAKQTKNYTTLVIGL